MSHQCGAFESVEEEAFAPPFLVCAALNTITTLIRTMSIKEQWKPVRGFESRYLISNLGRVKSIASNRIIKLQVKNDYQFYDLRIDGKKKQVSKSNLLREHWKYQFLCELEDDEMVKPYGDYFVTSKGRIWSNFYQRWLIPTNYKSYYYLCSLMIDGVRRNEEVARLVGKLFLDGFDGSQWVLHKDENLPYPEINYVDNLFLGTPSDNSRDRETKHRNKTRQSAEFVRQVRVEKENGLIGTEIAEKYNVRASVVQSILRGDTYSYIN